MLPTHRRYAYSNITTRPDYSWPTGARLAVYVALHANHPRELTPAARAACARLVDAGVPMLSQTVLLKGVNDDAETLGALMRAFVETRIKPYYLHHGDLAPGTGHFRTTLAEGQAVMRALRGRWSGLCQPTYVLDIPGGFVAASQMGCGRPASHRAWMGLSPPGSGAGSVAKASQISCGSPASQASWSGFSGLTASR